MKMNKFGISIFALLLSLTSCGGNNGGGNSSSPLKELFEQLASGYNFTLESVNEATTRRKIEVFDKYNYYYSYQTRTSYGASGLFYIEGQGVQDYELKDGEVNVLFHEGIGKVDVVEVFAHDDYGSQFAHIPMSSFLSVDYKKFHKDGDSYVSTDKDINRVFVYYTNNYFANWEKGNEDAYIDFSKSTTTITIQQNKVLVNFLPEVRNVGFDYTEDGSFLTISKIGSTSNSVIENYVSNPGPLVKKTGYGFDENKYQATFGTAVIPFTSKYSAYLDVLEYYSDKAINIFDIEFEDGIVEDIISNLSSDWEIAAEDAEYWTSEYGFDVHAYHTVAQVKEIVEDVEVTNDIEVYFLFGISPVELEDTEAGKILRPNGYFVGQIYCKAGEEVIEGSAAINEFFVGRGIDDLVPDFNRYRSLSLTMRDYSENPIIQASFEMQGIYLFGYYQITFNGVTSSNVATVTEYLRSDFAKISFYKNVTVDSDYNLSVEPDFDAFAADATFPMQALGSPIRDEQNNITGYQLIIISFTAIE